MSFLPIPDFPHYEISVDGVIRSWLKRGPRRGSRVSTDFTIITPVWDHNSDRWIVRLTKDGKKHLRCVANLVLLAHRGPPRTTNGRPPRAIYRDGDPVNITLDNLEWEIT